MVIAEMIIAKGQGEWSEEMRKCWPQLHEPALEVKSLLLQSSSSSSSSLSSSSSSSPTLQIMTGEAPLLDRPQTFSQKGKDGDTVWGFCWAFGDSPMFVFFH